MGGSQVRLLGCLLLLNIAGCGRIGFELAPRHKTDPVSHEDGGAHAVGSDSGTGVGVGSGNGHDAGGDAAVASGSGGGRGAGAASTGNDSGATDGGANSDAGLDAGGGGPVEACVFDVCASDVDRCQSDAKKTSPGICGCGVSDSADADGDGTADCNDRCPNAPDVLGNGDCGCAA